MLSAKTLESFKELPLPNGIAPVKIPEEEKIKRIAQQKEGLSFPSDFSAVRIEPNGKEIVAVGTSQDYDTDEGYWIIRSQDGGKTWTKPLYTGLRADIPYIVAPISNLPLNAGEKLQIEVELRNYDTSTLKFPPKVLNIKQLYLEVPWIELEKDTDQDGPTDLAEERLLTDPQNPDTDEDGIPDERDSLPLVSMEGTGSPKSAMMLAVLKNLAGEQSRDYLKTSAWDEIPDKTRVLTTEHTLFIVGNRLNFQSLIPASRMIILSPRELEAAKNKYGSFGVIDFSAIMLDSMKNRGYVIWKSSYWGGTIELKRIDGEWTIVNKTEWYS